VEHQWRTQPQIQSLLQQFSDHIYITRYVDNRIVLIDKSQQRHADIKHFLTDTFYEPPVLLEQEPDLSFLGCTIDPDRQTLSYITNQHLAIPTFCFSSIKATQTISSIQPDLLGSTTQLPT
jgi:hypothetical protein